jgi:tetratricopeptide (TPR) repeat protein
MGALVDPPRQDDSYLEKAVALDPDSPAKPARAHRAAGNPEAALLALQPDAVAPSDRAALLREASLIRASEGRVDEAERFLKQAIEIEPEDPPLRAALADLYQAKGDRDAAEEERALAASLGWESAEASSQDPFAGTGRKDGLRPTEMATDFEGLVASFPTRNPKTRQPFGPVALLGLVEDLDWKERLKDWLLPRTPDHQAIESLLIQSLLGRFELIETPRISAELEGPIDDLRALSARARRLPC